MDKAIKGKTPNVLLTIIFSNQKMHSNDRGHDIPDYSRKEFINYGLNSDEFWKLYRNWVLSDHKKDLVPSCDRLINTKQYTFDNIQFITWRSHIEKTAMEHKNGFIVGKLKPVIQFTLTGEYVNSFVSAYDANRITNIFHQNIRRVCREERHTAGGYKWKYAN